MTQQGLRGQIFTSDQHLLVGNTTEFQLVAYPYLLQESPNRISQLIQPLLLENYEMYQEATESARKEELADELKETLIKKLSNQEMKWVSLLPHLTKETRQKIEELELTGLGFEETSVRFYPEASMAAHLTGFIAKNDQGLDTGYFGVEGALD